MSLHIRCNSYGNSQSLVVSRSLHEEVERSGWLAAVEKLAEQPALPWTEGALAKQAAKI